MKTVNGKMKSLRIRGHVCKVHWDLALLFIVLHPCVVRMGCCYEGIMNFFSLRVVFRYAGLFCPFCLLLSQLYFSVLTFQDGNRSKSALEMFCNSVFVIFLFSLWVDILLLTEISGNLHLLPNFP